MNKATVLGSSEEIAAAVDTAIEDLKKLIETHERLSRKIVRSLVAILVVLVGSGVVVYLFESRMALHIITETNKALSEMRGQIKGEPGPGTDMVNSVIHQAASQITSFVNRQETIGAQNKSVLFVAVGLYAVVFGVLMTVYRHHLTEISKLQHYKIAFTRIRVAGIVALTRNTLWYC